MITIYLPVFGWDIPEMPEDVDGQLYVLHQMTFNITKNGVWCSWDFSGMGMSKKQAILDYLKRGLR